jgi:two-component system OmpR family sensor kinase
MSSPSDTGSTTIAAQDQRGWSLQSLLIASHAGLAAIVVLGFGAAMFAMTIHATYRQAEADLLGGAQVLVQDLGNRNDPSGLVVSELYTHRFGKAPRDHAYYAVWDSSGQLLASSKTLPPHAVRSDTVPPTYGPRPFLSRSQGIYLDIMVATPDGGQLLIGRPLAKEFDGLAWTAARLLTVGLICLVLGGSGAVWLARRIAKPIERMSNTAERITSRNLSERLEARQTPREITRLAIVINTMLDGLKSAFDRQVRFTADASHELRTPVSVVLSQADFTLSRERTPEQYREALETCLQSARRMKRLVDDLLVLSRADSGCLNLRHDSTDLSIITEQAVRLLHPLAGRRNMRLQTDLHSAPLVGDADRLSQVVTNLVTNSIQYGDANTTVWIEVHTKPDAAFLVVRDTGRGIPLADQPHLFERFYRVDRVRTQEEETGTGLGLSLVAEIVAAHGGTIQVASTEGTGTTMTVQIPTNSHA